MRVERRRRGGVEERFLFRRASARTSFVGERPLSLSRSRLPFTLDSSLIYSPPTRPSLSPFHSFDLLENRGDLASLWLPFLRRRPLSLSSLEAPRSSRPFEALELDKVKPPHTLSQQCFPLGLLAELLLVLRSRA